MKRESVESKQETSPSLSQPQVSTPGDEIYIPLDLTVEIIKKLRCLKSLTRFKCVSKQWSPIVTNRIDFIKKMRARSAAIRKRSWMGGFGRERTKTSYCMGRNIGLNRRRSGCFL
ncbi:unnamed protein product [Microthlaspi erraticum]|uniref:F-box domain-containing protein n=1 Tax=Microthlaspi erraticum TaxID=1685480 RepID=A0A6D2IXH2_9BRAS|nr:unnamed protein product [Microthlaspi erraticum]